MFKNFLLKYIYYILFIYFLNNLLYYYLFTLIFSFDFKISIDELFLLDVI